MNLPEKLLRLIIFVVLLSGVACESNRPAKISWDFTLQDVVGTQQADAKHPESIHIDLYLDATKSMEGFAAYSQSIYNRFIEELANMASLDWRNSDVRYYKFGTRIREIDKDEFLDARNKRFYNERGIYGVTNIDSVINRTDGSRVSVVITDLFQKEGDVNSIVLQIKERCFMRGIQVAIAGIKSEFDGIVFDANVPPFRYNSGVDDESAYRPFYAFIFGDPVNIERLFDSIKSSSFINEKNFVVISKYLINDFKVTLTKAGKSSGLNAQSREGGKFNHFRFVMREDANKAQLIANIMLTPKPRTPSILAEKLKFSALKKSAPAGKKVPISAEMPTKDFELLSIEGNSTQFKANLKLTLDDKQGDYSYMLYFQAPAFNGFKTPDWITDFSSENPTPQNDANKTLNLEKFFTNLMRVSASVYHPRIAKMYVTIKKL